MIISIHMNAIKRRWMIFLNRMETGIMETALIVLNYNDYKTTEAFLNNIKNITVIDKVVVVDNCSTDESFEKLKQYEGEKIDVIQTSKNEGYANGNNYGVFYAVNKYMPEYIMIANPDIELNEKAVRAIIDFYKEHDEKTGIVSCKMICTSDIKIREAWKLPRYSDCIMENLIVLNSLLGARGTTYPSGYFNGKYTQADVVAGSFFAIKADVFMSIKQFDTRTFLYGEENILAYKLKQKGFKNYILNDYSYVHNHSVSINKNIKSIGTKLDIAYESRCIYISEYLSVGKLKKVFCSVTYRIGKFNYLLAKKLFSKR